MPNTAVVLSSLASGFLTGGILALIALGLSISLDVMRLVNLAQGELLIGTAFSFTPSSCTTYLLIRFAVVVLGGVGNSFGTLVAGIVMGLLQRLGAVILGDGPPGLDGLVHGRFGGAR